MKLVDRNAVRGVRAGPAAAGRGRAEDVPSRTRRTLPLTVISPIRPGWTPFTRAVLQVLPQTPWGESTDLQELRFIQSARWSLVTGLPGPAGAVRLGYDYLYFESNFNGSLGAYLETFADVLPRRMRMIWNSSYGFPNLPADEQRAVFRRLRKPIPNRAFVDYVIGASVPTDHFYSAYPQASATEVLAGLQAQALVTDLCGRALAPRPRSLERAEEDAERFSAALTAAVVALQGRPPLSDQPAEAVGDQRGAMHAFTALTPVRPEAVDRLREELARLGPDEESPFAALPGVHFARWAVIDAVAHQPGQARDAWPHAYLLTSITSDGTTAPLAELHERLGPVRDEVWGRCTGYPDRPDQRAFVDYLARHRLPTGRFYSAYPNASVGAVRAGLHTHRRLIDFVRTHVGDTPQQRLAAFRTDFCQR